MKKFVLSLIPCAILQAGETNLTTVYQPLMGFGAGGIHLRTVTCKDHYASSAMSRAGLVAIANFAPTNSPEGPSDINLASLAGIRISDHSEDGRKHVLTIDCDSARKPLGGFDLIEIFRASLECLRLTYAEDLSDTTFVFKIPAGMAELREISGEFEKHDKSKPFFQSEE